MMPPAARSPSGSGARRLLGSLAVAAACASAFEGVARAQEQDAQALFDEAKRLAAANRYGEACPILERSLAADPALGTTFNLADCYEHVGRLGTAWHMFRRVEAGAHAVGQADREIRAHDRANALDARVARLTVNVGGAARLRDLRVLRDGAVVAQEAWGVPTPVDVGDHEIRAEAPDRVPWRIVIRIPADGVSRNVQVPVLAPEHAAAEQSPSPSVAADGAGEHGGGQRTTALVVGATGLLGVATGVLFGSLSLAQHTRCPGACVGADRDRQSDAYVYGNVSTASFAIGGAALVGSFVLWLTAPRRPVAAASAVRAGPPWMTVWP